MLKLCVRQRRFVRFTSSWINQSSVTEQNKNLDVEKVFINGDVQQLLYKITGLDMDGKLFRERSIGEQRRSQYHLMTDSMLQEALKKFEQRGRRFLQFIPFKEPRKRESFILGRDPELAQFDDSKFVFTDITFDATNRDRTVVVRETDGTLRTALPDEHDRMNRVYYEQPDRPVVPPAVFGGQHLLDALSRDKHEFVLDWACYFYEPDDPDFVELSKTVFDDVLAKEKFDLIHSTRHFGCFAFYVLLNNKVSVLLNYFGGKNDLDSAADVICLLKTIFPTWRITILAEDSPRKIVQDYLKHNKHTLSKVRKLVSCLEAVDVEN